MSPNLYKIMNFILCVYQTKKQHVGDFLALFLKLSGGDFFVWVFIGRGETIFVWKAKSKASDVSAKVHALKQG